MERDRVGWKMGKRERDYEKRGKKLAAEKGRCGCRERDGFTGENKRVMGAKKRVLGAKKRVRGVKTRVLGENTPGAGVKKRRVTPKKRIEITKEFSYTPQTPKTSTNVNDLLLHETYVKNIDTRPRQKF